MENFIELFNTSKHRIKQQEGCQSLELIQDVHRQEIFFTLSQWDAEHDLERYRSSELFKGIWKQTKALFESKAEAWTVESISHL